MSQIQVTPIKKGLFTESDSPQLLASTCKVCGHTVFPKQEFCPDCSRETMEEAKLSNRGKLKSFTEISAPPPGYKGEVPYTAGIVQFPEGIRVLGITTESSVENLRAEMEMEVILDTSYVEEDVNYVTYKYKPVSKEGGKK